MYQRLYDPKHQFMGLSTVPSDDIRRYQKGLREPLLCGGCEGRFSKYESYAAPAIFGGSRSFPVTHFGKGYIVGGLDYTKLKLFFLSLLWRFAVTRRTELKGMKLGTHHTEALRKMLVADSPGDVLDYPCLVTAVMWQNRFVGDLIVPPMEARLEGHRIWSIVIAGLLFSYYVSSHSPDINLHPGFLQKSSSLLILPKEITEIDFLYRFSQELRKAQKIRAAASQS